MAAAHGYIGRNPADSATVIARQSFSPTGIQTDFTFAAGYSVGYVDLYLNGARLIEGQDFSATDGSTVGLTTNAVNGDVLEVVAFKAFNATNVTASGGNFAVSQNLTVTGVSTFTGAITATGGVVGDATGLSGTPDITVRHLKATGISTVSDTTQSTTTTSGALIVSGGLGIAKNLFVGGSMNVAGTLTYEDVTNSETAGITTTGGLVVTGLGATFGSGVGIADSIYHIDDSNTAIRFPAADTFTVETGGSERLRIKSDGNVGIGTDDPTEKLHIFNRTSNGGLIHYDGASNSHFGLRIRSNSDGGNFESDFGNGTTAMLDLFADAGTVSGGDFLVCRSQAAIPILLAKGNGRIGIGTAEPDRLLVVAGSDPIIRSEDTDTGNTYAEFKQIAGSLFIDSRNDSSDGTIIFRGVGGGSATEKLRITSAGNVSIQNDSGKFTAGTGGDLEIYHDGTDSFVDNSTGDLILRSTGDDVIIRASDDIHIQTAGSENAIVCSDNGAVQLYFNAVNVFQTYNEGIKVIGDEGSSAGIRLEADQGDDNGDTWRINSNQDVNDLTISNDTSGSLVDKLTLTTGGNLTLTGTVSDSIGDLRSIPLNTQSSNASYTLQASDAGKTVHVHTTTTTVVVPNSVFSAGDAVSIVNGDGSNTPTISQGSGFSLRNTGDGSTGNRTLGVFGMATIYFTGAGVGYISGSGMT